MKVFTKGNMKVVIIGHCINDKDVSIMNSHGLYENTNIHIEMDDTLNNQNFSKEVNINGDIDYTLRPDEINVSNFGLYEPRESLSVVSLVSYLKTKDGIKSTKEMLKHHNQRLPKNQKRRT